MAVEKFARTTTEFLHVTVTATVSGASIAVTPAPQIAILAHDGNPVETDWYTAEWVGGTARLMVGPEGGAVTLEPGSYHVWIKFTAGIEVPVRESGIIHIY